MLEFRDNKLKISRYSTCCLNFDVEILNSLVKMKFQDILKFRVNHNDEIFDMSKF